MAPRLAPVLTELDLPLQELQAARLDGDLYAIGDGFASIDEFEQAHHRALSLGAIARPRFIAERMTAAWVHGAVPAPPAVFEFCVSHSARARAQVSPRVQVREVVIAPSDVVRFGGIAVTSPLRTVIDLLRAEGDFANERMSQLLRLMSANAIELDDCRREVESRHKLAGKRRALDRIATLGEAARS
ncbi:hypothetical protein [Salinibacterium sp. GXW1014]|uniref:hypothetical protein n=1 Tax=Salinibacterium sp. GXW1014 TaxID=3377838 RepID=UPI003839E49F